MAILHFLQHQASDSQVKQILSTRGLRVIKSPSLRNNVEQIVEEPSPKVKHLRG